MARASLVAIVVLFAALVACDRASVPSEAPAVVDAGIASDVAAPKLVDAIAIDASPSAPAPAPTMDASSPTLTKPAGKRLGAKCGASAECATGLACCDTGFTGHCGGARMPDQPTDPCVVLRSCARSPCTPLSFPP